MDTLDLYKIIHKDPVMNGKVEVVARNQLPKSPMQHRPFGFIINTDTSSMPGQHWVASYLPERFDQTAEYFDSFGLPPQSQDIISFFSLNSNSADYSKASLQSETTSTCGYWSIYYLRERMRNKSLPIIIENAQRFCYSPDCTVYKYINSIYSKAISLPVKRKLYPCATVCQTCIPRSHCHTQQP